MPLLTLVSVWIVALSLPLVVLWSSWRQRSSGLDVRVPVPGTSGSARPVARSGGRRSAQLSGGAHIQSAPLLNVSEQSVFERLSVLLHGTGFQATPSVRLLDFLDVGGNDRASESLRYRLMGHVDVLIVDRQYRPVVALEIDGPSHTLPRQVRRDRVKNEALAAAGIPLLRIPALGRRTGQDLDRQLAPFLVVR